MEEVERRRRHWSREAEVVTEEPLLNTRKLQIKDIYTVMFVCRECVRREKVKKMKVDKERIVWRREKWM